MRTKKMMMMKRREMLKAGALAAAAPMIVPSSVFGAEAPSEQMRLASIGTGRMGHGDMKACVFNGLSRNARVVATCDLDLTRAKHAKGEIEKVYKDRLGSGKYEEVKIYQDYREVLARKDIDGLTISTPDHWHALIAIAAAKAKKDMYLQKPFTHSIVEGQKLVKAVRANDVVFQIGSQQRSSVYFRHACELVRNGRLGKLHTIEVKLPTDHGSGKYVEMEPPSHFDYQTWLGPTPIQPYTQDRVHPQQGYGRPGWLQIEAYCRGMITGWGAHMYDIAQWGKGCDKTSGPVEVEATGEFPKRGIFDVHTNFQSTAYYEDGVKLLSGSGSPAGVKFIGDEGWIWVQRGSFKSEPESVLKEKVGDDEIKLYESKDHMGDFLDCMRSRKDPAAPAEVGHHSNNVCVIVHIAMKLGRKLKWDPKMERFVGDDEANRMLDFDHRAPYTV